MHKRKNILCAIACTFTILYILYLIYLYINASDLTLFTVNLTISYLSINSLVPTYPKT